MRPAAHFEAPLAISRKRSSLSATSTVHAHDLCWRVLSASPCGLERGFQPKRVDCSGPENNPQSYSVSSAAACAFCCVVEPALPCVVSLTRSGRNLNNRSLSKISPEGRAAVKISHTACFRSQACSQRTARACQSATGHTMNPASQGHLRVAVVVFGSINCSSAHVQATMLLQCCR